MHCLAIAPLGKDSLNQLMVMGEIVVQHLSQTIPFN